MIEVMPTVFSGLGKIGDFAWMQNQPEYAKTLFVFNDNEEQFDAFLDGKAHGFTAGGGNAIARPWRKLTPPKSAGIPTGRQNTGYKTLDTPVIAKIDQALDVINLLTGSGEYDRVVFSADSSCSKIGTGIFSVSDDVRIYIFCCLMDIK